jgi:hypothetical protein
VKHSRFDRRSNRASHSIGYLTSLLEHHGIDLPDRREQIEELTPWAVAARHEDRFDEALDRGAVRELVSILRSWSGRILADEWRSHNPKVLGSNPAPLCFYR